MSENGSYVTRAELSAHLNPIKEDIQEIRGDVKTLLERSVAVRAVAEQSKDAGARKLSKVALGVACLSGLWWVPDAVAKLTH